MKKAIGIVLLPPEETMDLAIKLNQTLIRGIEQEIVLDKQTCLPHITLAMGVIDENQLVDIQGIMQKIAKEFLLLELILSNTKISEHTAGQMSSLEFQPQDQLQKLHEAVMDQLAPLFTYDDVAKEMFFSPPPVDNLPHYWVKDFVRTKVRQNYWPHITLGLGKVEQIKEPIKFIISRMAVCHLGIFCTCREILAEVK